MNNVKKATLKSELNFIKKVWVDKQQIWNNQMINISHYTKK